MRQRERERNSHCCDLSLLGNLSKKLYLFLTVPRLEQVFYSGLDAASVSPFRAKKADGNK